MRFFKIFMFVLFFTTPVTYLLAQSQPEIETPPEQEEVLPNTDEAQSDTGMTLEKMIEIVKAIDEDAEIAGPSMQLTISETRVTIITDPANNRMRAFVPIKTLDGVNQQILYRMLQANFDSALDARYAIAKGYILSVYIHPLKELDKNEFIEGLGQVVNLVKTYGGAFTSGAMTFGGGDSNALHRQLIDDLLKKGEEI